MGRKYEQIANNSQSTAKKNILIDPALLRHIYQPLQMDFEKLFERESQYLDILERKLGSNDSFDLPTDQHKRLHNQVEALKRKLDILCCMHDFINDLIDSAIEFNGQLSSRYFEMMRERDMWRQISYAEQASFITLLETQISRTPFNETAHG